MSALHTSFSQAFFLEANVRPRPWWRNPHILFSLAIHVLVIAGLWGIAQSVVTAPPIEKAIELVLERTEQAKAEPPPKPEPVAKPVQLAQPRHTVALPLKAVAAPAEKAETYTAPPVQADTHEPEVRPVEATPPVAKSGPPAPRVISSEGIPSDYVNQVYTRINRNTNYPRSARSRREEGRVVYRLTLSPQGQLLKFDIQSSGNPDLDEAAKDAIKAAAPFPKLPDLGGSSYLLSGAIAFKIN